ncbi:mucin-5AC-like [Amphibalanus amphitrite]|uniref:mucin-5AC-like n=1 Tax=Amphibalanus amphitrite TaxID=1232801 RepID=UPI001C92B741|nr:mucin-5AC-like [Amphibalanus amphitrite]
MTARKVHLYWAAVLICSAQLRAAPAPGGRPTTEPADLASARAYFSDGSSLWVGRRHMARSWRDRTPAGYRDRVRQPPRLTQTQPPGPAQTQPSVLTQTQPWELTQTQRLELTQPPKPTQTQPPELTHRTSLVSQEGEDRSVADEHSVVDDTTESEIKAKAKAIVSGVRVDENEWRAGYGAMKTYHHNKEHTTTEPQRPSERVTYRPPPKLSYIQRRRPFGAAATIGGFGTSTARLTPKPSQPTLSAIGSAATIASRPFTLASEPTVVTDKRLFPPMQHSIHDAGNRHPAIEVRPPQHSDSTDAQRPPGGSRDHLPVVNAAGLVPGSVINTKLSGGLTVPESGHQTTHQRRTTASPDKITENTPPKGASTFTTSIIRRRKPYTRRPETPTTSTPSVEVLNLYEVGVLPNVSKFLNQSRKSGGLSQGSRGQAGHWHSGSSGGTNKVTFPLYVLPALPGAPPPPDWPTVRPSTGWSCCKGHPGHVTPVDPPDRPVYPSVGSGHRPIPPPLQPPTIPTRRPLVPPSTSYGPPPLPPVPSRPTPPTRRPCGSGQCVYRPPRPPAGTISPPAPPPTASSTSLGNVGDDLVCVYLRANGSALVLRADLATGRYNISDEHNHPLGAAGWLGSDQTQLLDRPASRSKYEIVYIDNLGTTVKQLMTRLRNRSQRWEETHRPKTSIVCIVQRPESKPDEGFNSTVPPKPSEEPTTPNISSTASTPTTATATASTPTPRPTILGSVDTLSATIASAVDTLGATAEAQLSNTMTAADQTAVVIGSNVKNYIGNSIPNIALATTVGIPVFVAMLALLGAPPLLLSALSVSSPILLQSVAALYNSLPN